MTLTANDVSAILQVLEDSSFDELSLEMDGVKLTLRRGEGSATTAAPQGQLDAVHLQRQLVEAGVLQHLQDRRNVIGRQGHTRRPPKTFITCARGFSAGLAAGGCSRADQTVSGRLCSSRIWPAPSTAHSMSCGRP